MEPLLYHLMLCMHSLNHVILKVSEVMVLNNELQGLFVRVSVSLGGDSIIRDDNSVHSSRTPSRHEQQVRKLAASLGNGSLNKNMRNIAPIAMVLVYIQGPAQRAEVGKWEKAIDSRQDEFTFEKRFQNDLKKHGATNMNSQTFSFESS